MKTRGKNHINEVILSVKDTGIGIGPEILPRLFTMFATESEIGTGLGLFISKEYSGSTWWEGMGRGLHRWERSYICFKFAFTG